MSVYNVGPHHVQFAAFPRKCEHCGETNFPQWDGCDGVWLCSDCLEPVADDDDTLDPKGFAGDNNAF